MNKNILLAVSFIILLNLGLTSSAGCLLNPQKLATLKDTLGEQGVYLDNDELSIWMNQYNQNKIENVKVSESIAKLYNLSEARIIIEEGAFKVNTPVLTGATAFVCAREGQKIQTYKRPVKANKLFESCQVTEGNWVCEISNDSTTAYITYEIKEPNFFIQTLEGEIKYISQDGEVDYTRVISLNLVNYCAELKGTGIQIVYIVIIGGLLASIGAFLIYKRVKKRKKR